LSLNGRVRPAKYCSSVQVPGDFAVALVGFVLLMAWRAPPLVVVVVSAIGGVLLALPGS
jgi:chromate transporter